MENPPINKNRQLSDFLLDRLRSPRIIPTLAQNKLRFAVDCFQVSPRCLAGDDFFTPFVKRLRWSNGVDLDGSLGGTDIAGFV